MIDNHGDLETLIVDLGDAAAAGVDTEMVWERTFYPKLGVIQIALPQDRSFLIDVPAVAAGLSALGPFLGGSGVKILHDAVQDLTVLRRATGASSRSVFDTRVAAGFAGLSCRISLRDLLKEVLSIELEKTETRTDWLQRPLSAMQIEYARKDVCFLIELRERLLERARDRGLENWLEEEMASLNDPSLYEERDPRCQYDRIKGSGKLNRRGLAVLRELAAWRDEMARELDRPRSRILADKTLLTLSSLKPKTSDDLRKVRGFRDSRIERYGAGLLSAVQAGLAVREGDCPKAAPRSRYDERVDKRAAEAIRILERRSAERGIDHELVATRSEVRQLMRPNSPASADARLLQGWRREFLGNELEEMAQAR